MASPVMAPCPLAYVEGTRKSMKPPKTTKGTVETLGFFLGKAEAKDALETVSQIRVSFPTFPQL